MALTIRRFLELIFLLVILPLALLYLFTHNNKSVLGEIRANGYLQVITVNRPTTFYKGANGYAGFEHDLVRAFADYLGVDLKVQEVGDFNDVLPELSRGTAHFAAAGITVTKTNKKSFRFGPTTEKITQQLIYREGNKRPKDISEIINGHLEVVAGRDHILQLKTLRKKYSKLRWNEHNDKSSEELMHLVWLGLADFTVANSNAASIQRFYYPELYVAFDLTESRNLAWAFPKSKDNSLYKQAIQFFDEIRADGRFRQIRDRYYGHIRHLGYVGKYTFMKHVYNRLSKYEQPLKEVAQKYAIDWRFLAAIAYQESHWKPDAVSPTGVAGMMMLTERTAKQLNIKDRTQLLQSLDGGVRYFNIVKKKIPKRIPEPDHTWLALAAYNIGYGHLEDARIITQQMGGDPDKWIDVEKNLPLLAKKKWYRKTKRGYARGHESVTYVRNIRSYYDLLVWHTTPRFSRVHEPARVTHELAPSSL